VGPFSVTVAWDRRAEVRVHWKPESTMWRGIVPYAWNLVDGSGSTSRTRCPPGGRPNPFYVAMPDGAVVMGNLEPGGTIVEVSIEGEE